MERAYIPVVWHPLIAGPLQHSEGGEEGRGAETDQVEKNIN